MSKFFFELKNRFILTGLLVFFLFVVLCIYKEFFLFLLIKVTYSAKMTNKKYIYFIVTDVTEFFHSYALIIISFTAQTGCYYIFYHFYNFFSPALFKEELRNLKQILKISLIFFGIALAFAFLFGIANTWFFFLNLQNSSGAFIKTKIFFEINISEYVKFLISSYFYFFFSFQLLFIFILFYTFNNITSSFVNFFRKFHYFLCYIVAILISPPELMFQLIVFIFSVFIYEFFTITIFIKKTLS